MSHNTTESEDDSHERIEQINDEEGIEDAWSRVVDSDELGFVIDKNDGRVSRYRSNGEGNILKEVETGEMNRYLSRRDLRMVLGSSYDIHLTTITE